MSFLDLARRVREERRPEAPGLELVDAPVVEARQRVAAVRLRSPDFGDVWLALDPATAAELVAEGSGVPVLQPLDVRRLRGKSDEEIRAALAVMAVFPGARILQ